MTYNSIKTTESANSSDPDVAVDRISGKDFQRIKAGWGPEGTQNDTDDTSGKRFPVNVAESALIGAVDETAPVSDIASSGLNGRLQRIAQRLTSLIALLPTALGSTSAAGSLAVTASTEDVARMGIITETAPASDTASSGLNGRLQRIAQRLTSLIALVPTALTSAGNFKVGILEFTQTSMTYAHTQPSATTTSGDMLGANASRKYALLTNIGSVDVYIKINAAAVVSQGILLQAYGGTYEISPANNNFTTAVIRGITASGTATVLVAEGT